MIDGITILSQSEIMKSANFLWLLIFLILIGVCLAGALINMTKEKVFLVFLFSVSAIVFAIIFRIIPSEIKTDKYEYKVTIDESVSMTEFLEQYEIINQDGLIYTIKEKED